MEDDRMNKGRVFSISRDVSLVKKNDKEKLVVSWLKEDIEHLFFLARITRMLVGNSFFSSKSAG
jgi:hypothetical protein